MLVRVLCKTIALLMYSVFCFFKFKKQYGMFNADELIAMALVKDQNGTGSIH